MKRTRLLLLASLLLSGTAMAQQHITLSSYTGQAQIKATGSVTLTDGFQIPYGNNVRIFTGASFQQCELLTFQPSATQNYVLSRVFKIAGVNSSNINASRSVCEENQTIQYIDGLGRPLQSVTVQGSPSFADVVQPIAYDALGREAVKYQSYTVAGNNGAYRASAVTEQLGFYNSPTLDPSIKATSQPFSQTVFEASTLNRVLEQGAPGAPWQPYNAAIANSGHTLKPGYLINDATDAVKLWTINASGASTAANYVPGRLYKTVSRDENWTSGRAGTVEEFKDLEGRVVLKKVWETENLALSTQYLYDDMGSLRYVLPPAVTANSFTEADAVFKNYIYGYHYDGRKRVIEKKIPGKGWEHLVYNKLDQVVLTQDSVQRTNGQWLFTKYDVLGRTIITGLLGSTSTRAMWQTRLDGQTVFWETRDDANASGSGTGYTNVSSPSADITSCLTISYYDDYGFLGNIFGAPAGTQASGGRTRGLPTGTKINIPSTGAMLLTVTYYDDEGRAIQTKSQNHLTGTDILDNSYNFAGELVASTRTHTASPNGTPTTIATRYEYDHMGRKLATMEEINSQGEVTLAKLDYNELGQLKKKNLHSTDGTSFLQAATFAYNERGWMKNSTSDQFSMQLKYEDGTTPQFNGNIANQLWGAGSSLPNTFAYTYDRLNRLLNGSTTAGIAMGETLTYDAMGNINTLNRDGAGTRQYNYNGNQLTSVAGVTGTYAYDGNGNAVTDGRNGVGLTYNYLNLPISAVKSGLNLSYVYDGTGAKLRKTSTVTSVAVTDYVGGIQYNNGTIDFIQTETGIARNSGGNYSYEYNLTDHLGNVRYTFNRHPVTGQLQPLQADNYYAFGMRRTPVAIPGTNKYLYNGKELQEELEQYDYGARFYDPVIGRWNVVDPLAEQMRRHSPYNYTFNNPMRFIDPDGMGPNDIILIGSDKKEWRIKASGDNVKYNVPVALKTNKDLDFGLDNAIDGSKYAVGYSANVTASGASILGASASAELSVVNFSNSKYGNYNYTYAGLAATASAGVQEGLDVAAGGSFFVAVNITAKSDADLAPESFAGKTDFVGVSGDLKAVVGGGFTVSGFSMSSGWKGIQVGVNVGAGEAVNAGSVHMGLSNSVLLNQEVPTSKRSFADRAFNSQYPILSGLGSYIKNKLK